MNYRQKCKNYGKWSYVQYEGDLAVYATCLHCGFIYNCSTFNVQIMKSIPNKPYKYCPNCGLKMSINNNNF